LIIICSFVHFLSGGNPARGWDGDEVVGEVDEDVQAAPVAEVVAVLLQGPEEGDLHPPHKIVWRSIVEKNVFKKEKIRRDLGKMLLKLSTCMVMTLLPGDLSNEIFHHSRRPVFKITYV
jgi:hypothetical protein